MSATTRGLPLPVNYPLNLLQVQRRNQKRKECFPEISTLYQILSVNIGAMDVGFVESYLHLIQFERRLEV